MIKRIVKLTFQLEKIDEFKLIFENSKDKIRAFEGCNHVELLQDNLHANIFFTLSYWDSQVCLDKYRNSDLFKSTWLKTKVLFADKAQAWSLLQINTSTI